MLEINPMQSKGSISGVTPSVLTQGHHQEEAWGQGEKAKAEKTSLFTPLPNYTPFQNNSARKNSLLLVYKAQMTSPAEACEHNCNSPSLRGLSMDTLKKISDPFEVIRKPCCTGITFKHFKPRPTVRNTLPPTHMYTGTRLC
jgi:hypothetical protein